MGFVVARILVTKYNKSMLNNNAAPKVLKSATSNGLRFDMFQTRFSTIEYFLVDAEGETLFQGSLGNCISRAARVLGMDVEWAHGQACGPNWREAEEMQRAVKAALDA